jgi:hypothetical protein
MACSSMTAACGQRAASFQLVGRADEQVCGRIGRAGTKSSVHRWLSVKNERKRLHCADSFLGIQSPILDPGRMWSRKRVASIVAEAGEESQASVSEKEGHIREQNKRLLAMQRELLAQVGA